MAPIPVMGAVTAPITWTRTMRPALHHVTLMSLHAHLREYDKISHCITAIRLWVLFFKKEKSTEMPLSTNRKFPNSTDLIYASKTHNNSIYRSKRLTI